MAKHTPAGSSHNSQSPGGDADRLPNNWTDGAAMAHGNSTGPKFSGSGGGNATGPMLTNNKGQQSNG